MVNIKDDFKNLDLTVGDVFSKDARLKARNVNVFYGINKAIDNVTIDIGNKEVISFIGPLVIGSGSWFLQILVNYIILNPSNIFKYSRRGNF